MLTKPLQAVLPPAHASSEGSSEKDGMPVFEEERTNLMAVSEKPILTFTIDFETAKRYREVNKMPHQFRRAAWTDLTVEVYL